MSDIGFVLLYVEEVARSANFYAKLLDKPVVEASETFAMLPVAPGLMLGLWRRDQIQPPAGAAPGASEIAVVLPDDGAVTAAHERWVALGAPIAQAPTRLDFGYSCVALDPDGHRLRAFAPGDR